MSLQSNLSKVSFEEIFFESDAKIYKHIGRNQIDSETIALIEIVKNSYDADATEVNICFDNTDKENGEIIITDDGNGMSEKEFKDHWMKPATDHKESEPRSLVFRRNVLGRKGMGRFGTDKIGTLVVIKCKTKNEYMGFVAKIDGDKFDQPNAKFEKTPVELSRHAKSELKFVLKNYNHGVEIRLKKLRTRWTKSMIKEIINELSNMISPDSQSSNFNIVIDVKGNTELSGKLENKLSMNASHEINVAVDENDTFSISLNGHVLKTGDIKRSCEEKYLDSTGSLDELDEFTDFKSFGKLNAKILYYKDGGLIKRETVKHGKRIDHSGVKVYRSGFRVLPYGEKDDDWLGIKAKRSSRGGQYFIIPDKVSGFVKIDSQNNPQLEDTTNRQSLLVNEQVKSFQFFFAEIVMSELNKVLGDEQSIEKEEIRKKRYQNVSRQVAEVLSKLNSDVVRKDVERNNARNRNEAKRLVNETILDVNGEIGNRKTHEKKIKDKNIKKDSNIKDSPEKNKKHSRSTIKTNRTVVRPVDAWIEGTRWIVRPEHSPNDELEAWVNDIDQEIIYNTGHTMFIASELSDKVVGNKLDSGSGIAVQIQIHKSVAVAWGLYHETKESGTFLERYKEYQDVASELIKGNSKTVEDVPEEELEKIIDEI